MKTCYPLSFLLSAFAIATVSADTIEMKDGTKYEGTILKRDGDDYIVEVRVTKSIKDERRIPKADVARIVAEDKEEVAFTEAKALVPVPDLLTAADYQPRIAKAEAFFKTYKNSKHQPEIRKIIDTLETESAAIAAGGIKMDGKIITAAQRKPQAYSLDAKLALAGVKSLAEKGDTVGALRAWSAFEKDFQGSTAYREGIPYGIRLMQGQLATVTQTLSTIDARIKQREEGLKSMSDQDRSRSKSVIDEEMAAYKSKLEAEKTQQIKWLSLDPFVKQPQEDAKRSLDSEIKRLQNVSVANLPKTEESYNEAWAAITKEGATKSDINTAISKARSYQLPTAYVDILTSSSPIPLDSK